MSPDSPMAASATRWSQFVIVRFAGAFGNLHLEKEMHVFSINQALPVRCV